jgi:hypothetical protein
MGSLVEKDFGIQNMPRIRITESKQKKLALNRDKSPARVN